ncbi:hypothetical protein BEWA_004340 [Theileria equi strain WA]|uniref:Uncharacterized protein n=1 Tax=Theileria equi strain WA TaxID=1537102 RepID=L0B1A5_THEEQ|nr:hypothetical protein BEWA_004340 [Theileria equi strain WA]AFZ81026.1 hypothetical protein BEWA_004340 [Theileria equi strain WA]|eukprot:XP_004830692.1 hypothetical protein BEWA_004340 [Theileria equi strain WA]
MAKDGEVTIKLSQKPTSDGTPETYTGNSTGGRIIQVKLTSGPTQNFFKYEHALQAGGTQLFHLMEIWDDNNSSISRIKGGKDVTLVEAYYWKDDKSGSGRTPGKALLVGITIDTKTTYYKDSGGNEWIEQAIDAEKLEKELENLNCYNNNAVTLDLSKSLSTGQSYCCEEHRKTGTKIVVDKGEIIRDGNRKVGYTKYSITGGQLVGIKFYKDDVSNDEKYRRRITTTGGLKFPITGTVDIYAIHSDKNPELIYVKSTGTKNPVTGWFQRGSDDNGKWTEVSAKLSGVDKDKIDNKQLSCQQWKALTGVLKHGDSDFVDCPEEPEQQSSGRTYEVQGSRSQKEEEEEKKEESFQKAQSSAGSESPQQTAAQPPSTTDTLGTGPLSIKAGKDPEAKVEEAGRGPASSSGEDDAEPGKGDVDAPPVAVISKSVEDIGKEMRNVVTKAVGSVLDKSVVARLDSTVGTAVLDGLKCTKLGTSPKGTKQPLPAASLSSSGSRSPGGSSEVVQSGSSREQGRGRDDKGSEDTVTPGNCSDGLPGNALVVVCNGNARAAVLSTAQTQVQGAPVPAAKADEALSQTVAVPTTSRSADQADHQSGDTGTLTQQGASQSTGRSAIAVDTQTVSGEQATSQHGHATPDQAKGSSEYLSTLITLPTSLTPTQSAPPEQLATGLQNDDTPPPPESPQRVLGLAPTSIAGYIIPSVFGGSGAAGLAGWKLYKLFKNFRDPWVLSSWSTEILPENLLFLRPP